MDIVTYLLVLQGVLGFGHLKPSQFRKHWPSLKKFFAEQFVPDILQSDNGPQFKNGDLAALCAELNIQQRFGASETPQHQGQIERFNKTFKTNLFRWIKQQLERLACETWYSTGLNHVITQYRRNIHSTTNMPPDMIMFGTMRTPEDRKSYKKLTKSLLALVDVQNPPNSIRQC